MDIASVFLLSALGGYCFAYVWCMTSFATRRAEGQHLYFRAGLSGSVLFLLALGLRSGLMSLSLLYATFDARLTEYVRPLLREEAGLSAEAQMRREGWAITAVYSLFLGIAGGVVANVVTPRRRVLSRTLSNLDRLMLEAHYEKFPVMLTLKGGRVYVGLVAEALDSFQEPSVVILTPLFIGSCDDGGRILLATDYETVYEKLTRQPAASLGRNSGWSRHFQLMLCTDEVVTVAPFSESIYSEFNPGWRERLASQSQRTATGGDPPPPVAMKP